MSIVQFQMIAGAPPWLEPALLGSDFASIFSLSEGNWEFGFGDHCTVTTAALWRVVGPTGIVVTSEDHGNRFGLPSLVDACEKVAETLSPSARITAVSISRATADLRIYFGPATFLDIISTSSGYEAWQLRVRLGSDALELIAQGGGNLAVPVGQRD